MTRLTALLLIALAMGCNDPQQMEAEVAVRTHAATAHELPSPYEHALEDYVRAPDPTFDYRYVATQPGPGVSVDILNMNSLSWRTPDEVTPNVWNHWIYVVTPETVLTDKVILIVTGGRMSATPDTDDVALFGPIASATGSVVAVLSQVPGQALEFSERPGEGLREDALVAYSWRRMMESGDPTWSVYLPMVKSIVRGMDAVEDHLSSTIAPSGFVLTGFSKRGVTSWLAAAVDERVQGVVPGVSNLLNLADVADNQFRSYGTYADAVSDYTEQEVLQQLRSPEGQLLASIVDPINYREQLTMPHYLLQASGDEFFLPDASRNFIDAIPGATVQRIVPNESHSLENQLEPNLLALVAWYQTLLSGQPFPTVEEQVEGSTVAISVDQPVLSAVAWRAQNADLRDFRFTTIGATWSGTAIEADADGTYRVPLQEPAEGYEAMLVEFTFAGIGGIPQRYTTGTYITPDNYPVQLESPILAPRSARAWRRAIRRGTVSDEELRSYLPARVLGEYVRSPDDVSNNLRARGWGSRARRACTAARLNVESGDVGWYTPIASQLDYWQAYQVAEQQFMMGSPGVAALICTWLSHL